MREALALLLSLVPAACAAAPDAPPLPAPRLGEGAADAAADANDARPPGRLPQSPLARAPSPPSVARPGSDGSGSHPDGALLRVGDREITAADLGDHVLRHDPDAAFRALDALAEAALVEIEAAREGVSVGDEAIAATTDRALEERRRALRLEHGAAVDPDAVLRERHGRTPEQFREDVRAAVRNRLLRDRLVRLSQLREDGVEIRVLVLPDEASARDAARLARGGADLTLLAQRLGLRPPAAPAPMTRAEVTEAALRDALFAADAGTVLDPVPFEAEPPGRTGGTVTGETVRAWQVFKVVRSWRGSAAAWADLEGAVVASLASAPVKDAEVRRWRARAAEAVAAAAGKQPSASPSPPATADDAAKGLAPGPDAR